MARIAGIDIPRDKRVEVSLTYIFGIGRSRSKKMLEELNIDKGNRVKDLGEDEVIKLREYIEKNFKVEGELKQDIVQNIKRKMEIGCYEGLRHRKKLPVRGQRTRTNARTHKGHRPSIGTKTRRGVTQK